MQEQLTTALMALEPAHIAIENESHLHAGPAVNSHFKVVLVSEVFAGLRQVARHQKVYALVGELLKGELHALALHTYTPDEWQGVDAAPTSPACAGKRTENR